MSLYVLEGNDDNSLNNRSQISLLEKYIRVCVTWHFCPRSSYKARDPFREPTAIRRLEEQCVIWLKRHKEGNTSESERPFK